MTFFSCLILSTRFATKFQDFIYTPSMTGQQKWLITGGTGYIGAHIADAFLASGKNVEIYDSLCRGSESRITYLRKKYSTEIPLTIADVRDAKAFKEILGKVKPYGIVHTAALKSVEESMTEPEEYFDINFRATKKILEIIKAQGINHFIFSSTAAVYGAPDQLDPIQEDHEKSPLSPYGASKLAAEEEVSKFLSIVGNYGTSLRFFNVVGTTAQELLDNSIENLVPIVINKLKLGQAPVIYGTDYPTPDGTCIRDYVDVRDIARAHLAVADSKENLPLAMNIGTGRGHSVREVIRLLSAGVNQSEFTVAMAARRAGDPAFLIADNSLIKRSLGFNPMYSLEDSVESLYQSE